MHCFRKTDTNPKVCKTEKCMIQMCSQSSSMQSTKATCLKRKCCTNKLLKEAKRVKLEVQITLIFCNIQWLTKCFDLFITLYSMWYRFALITWLFPLCSQNPAINLSTILLLIEMICESEHFSCEIVKLYFIHVITSCFRELSSAPYSLVPPTVWNYRHMIMIGHDPLLFKQQGPWTRDWVNSRSCLSRRKFTSATGDHIWTETGVIISSHMWPSVIT